MTLSKLYSEKEWQWRRDRKLEKKIMAEWQKAKAAKKVRAQQPCCPQNCQATGSRECHLERLKYHEFSPFPNRPGPLLDPYSDCDERHCDNHGRITQLHTVTYSKDNEEYPAVIKTYNLSHMPTMENFHIKSYDLCLISKKNLLPFFMAGLDHSSKILLIAAKKTDLSLLTENLDVNNTLSENKAKYVFHEVFQGLKVWQSNFGPHGDLRSENIYCDGSRIVKLGFPNGIRRYTESNCPDSQNIYTEYGPPEAFTEKDKHYLASDIWTAAVSLFQVICGSMPFKGTGLTTLIQEIAAAEVEFPDTISEDLKDLLRKMLAKSPESRPTVEDVLNHPWFASIKEDSLLGNLPFSENELVTPQNFFASATNSLDTNQSEQIELPGFRFYPEWIVGENEKKEISIMVFKSASLKKMRIVAHRIGEGDEEAYEVRKFIKIEMPIQNSKSCELEQILRKRINGVSVPLGVREKLLEVLKKKLCVKKIDDIVDSSLCNKCCEDGKQMNNESESCFYCLLSRIPRSGAFCQSDSAQKPMVFEFVIQPRQNRLKSLFQRSWNRIVG